MSAFNSHLGLVLTRNLSTGPGWFVKQKHEKKHEIYIERQYMTVYDSITKSLQSIDIKRHPDMIKKRDEVRWSKRRSHIYIIYTSTMKWELKRYFSLWIAVSYFETKRVFTFFTLLLCLIFTLSLTSTSLTSKRVFTFSSFRLLTSTLFTNSQNVFSSFQLLFPSQRLIEILSKSKSSRRVFPLHWRFRFRLDVDFDFDSARNAPLPLLPLLPLLGSSSVSSSKLTATPGDTPRGHGRGHGRGPGRGPGRGGPWWAAKMCSSSVHQWFIIF